MGQEGLRKPSASEIEEIVNTYWKAIDGSSGKYWNKYLYDTVKSGKTPTEAQKDDAFEKLYKDTLNGDFAKTVSTKACTISGDKHGYGTGCRSNRWYGVAAATSRSTGKYKGQNYDSQCAGFASYMAYLVYGTRNDKDFEKISAKSLGDYTPQAGDLLRLRGSAPVSHSIFVYKVVGDTVYYIEGNGDGHCKIKKNSDSRSNIMNRLKEPKKDKNGKIIEWGYVRRIKNPDILEEMPTYVQLLTTSAIEIKKTPFSASEKVGDISLNKVLIASKIVKNKYGNYWYFIPAENGYISASWVRYAGRVADSIVSYDGTDITGSIKLSSKQYHLPGKVKQPANLSIKLKAEILPLGSDKVTTSSSQTFTGKSLWLCSKSGGSSSCSNAVCQNLKFGSLSSGVEYIYRLTPSYTLYHCADQDDKSPPLSDKVTETSRESLFHIGKLVTKYTVSFNANGGSGSMASFGLNVGDSFKISENTFSRGGYTFKGWNLYRGNDKTWYVSGQGWKTESEITQNKYTKRLYSDKQSLTLDDSWTSGISGSCAFTFYADWEIDNSAAVYLSHCKSYPCDVTITVKKTAYAKSLPCSAETNENSVTIGLVAVPVGSTYTASQIWENSVGHYWYQTTFGGKTAYFFGGDVTTSLNAPDFSISEERVPSGTWSKAASYDIKGIISSTVLISSVSAAISGSGGSNKTVKEINKKSFDIYKEINSALKFGSLGNGSHVYTVDVTTLQYYSPDGYALKTASDTTRVLNCPFSIGSTITSTNTISFFSNGGSGTNPNDFSVSLGDTITLPDCPYSAPAGEYFYGWNIDRPDGMTRTAAGVWEYKSDMSYTGNDIPAAYAEGSKIKLDNSWFSGYSKEYCEFCIYPDWKSSNSCGSQIGWTLENGVLNLNGSGSTYAYSYSPDAWHPVPWSGSRESIRTAIVGDRITDIGERVFDGCSNMTSIWLPSSLKSIGPSAFNNCYSLQEIYFDGPESQWEAVQKAVQNDALVNAVVYYNKGYDNEVHYHNADMPETMQIKYRGVPMTLIVPEQSGLIFKGWSLSDNLQSVDFLPGSVYYEDAPLELWAVWGFAEDMYFITYLVSDDLWIYNDIVDIDVCYPEYDTVLTSKIIENYKIDGRKIIGWNTKEGQTTVKYCFGETYTGRKDLDLYGVWIPESYKSGSCGNTSVWVLDDEGTLTISGRGAMYDFTSDTQPWAAYRDSIQSIVISPDITTLGYAAFEGCGNLTDVTIPQSVTSIRDRAFHSCSRLTNVYYTYTQGQWNTIAIGSFNDCLINAAKEYNSIPCIARGHCGEDLTWRLNEDGLLSIHGTGAMYDFSPNTQPWDLYSRDIYNVLIDYGVTSIGDHAFDCYNIDNVTIPNSVTRIGDYAFEGCLCLTSVTIPDSVTSIGNYAFESCSLYTVNIPNSVTGIGECAFEGCSSLQSITIADSVTFIGDYAFNGCYNLSEVVIPSSLTSIGKDVFCGCGLKSVTIPESVTRISGSAFSYCEKLTDVYYIGSEEQWNRIIIESNNDCLKNATKHYNHAICIASGECGENTSWTLDKKGVLRISGAGIYNYPFLDAPWSSRRSEIKTLVLDGVESIGLGAFYDCTALTDVTFPDTLKAIGMVSFAGCTSLTELNLPDGLLTIGGGAFSYCTGLTEITLPDSLQEIYGGIFSGGAAFEGCANLTAFHVSDGNVNYSSENGVLFNKDKSVLWQYPIASEESYTIPDSVTTINGFAFRGCTGLCSIIIPSGVKEIREYAFQDCDSLESVYYDGTLEDWELIDVYEGNERLMEADIYLQEIGSAGEMALREALENPGIEFVDFTGCLTLSSDLTIPEGKEFHIPYMSRLIVPREVTLSVEGYISIEGTLDASEADNLILRESSDIWIEHRGSLIVGSEAYYSDTDWPHITVNANTYLKDLRYAVVGLSDDQFVYQYDIYSSEHFYDAMSIAENIPEIELNIVFRSSASISGSFPENTRIGIGKNWEDGSPVTVLVDKDQELNVGRVDLWDAGSQFVIFGTLNADSVCINAADRNVHGNYFVVEETGIAYVNSIESYDYTWILDYNELNIRNLVLVDGNLNVEHNAELDLSGSRLEMTKNGNVFVDCGSTLTIDPENYWISEGNYIGADITDNDEAVNAVAGVRKNEVVFCKDIFDIEDLTEEITLAEACPEKLFQATIRKDCELYGNIPSNLTVNLYYTDEYEAVTMQVPQSRTLTLNSTLFVSSSDVFTVNGTLIMYAGVELRGSAVFHNNGCVRLEYGYAYLSGASAIDNYGRITVCAIDIYDAGCTLRGNEPIYNAGVCGDDLLWILDESDTLTVSGTGNMTNNYRAWDAYKDVIRTLVIQSGVTSIGEQAFTEWEKLTSVTIPNSVQSIGEDAFFNCDSLTDVYFRGTEDEWNNIDISDGNKCLTNATIHFGGTPSGVPGDVTGDDDITIADVVRLNRAVLGKITLNEKKKQLGDVTYDGNITIADVVKLNRFVLGIISSLEE